MRILSWVQRKFHVRHERKRSDVGASSARHTFNQEPRKEEFDGWPEALLSIGTLGKREVLKSKSDTEELKKLQEELTLLLRAKGVATEEEERHDRSLKRFLQCPSSLQDDASKNDGIKQRSFRVLGTSVFSGFAPSRSLREPISESTVEKILWTLLHKKMHPQNSTSSAAAVIKKYLDDRPVEKAREFGRERGEDGGKWVRTDSEYIVLEI